MHIFSYSWVQWLQTLRRGGYGCSGGITQQCLSGFFCNTFDLISSINTNLQIRIVSVFDATTAHYCILPLSKSCTLRQNKTMLLGDAKTWKWWWQHCIMSFYPGTWTKCFWSVYLLLSWEMWVLCFFALISIAALMKLHLTQHHSPAFSLYSTSAFML